MYDDIKKAFGPCIQRTATLNSKQGIIITDKKQQIDCWVEHYLELYSRQNKVTSVALDAVEQLPVLAELDDPQLWKI